MSNAEQMSFEAQPAVGPMHRPSILLPLLLSMALGEWLLARAMAGPILCRAAPPPPGLARSALDAVHCTSIVTTDRQLEEDAFSWTAPHGPGINTLHQLTDLLGVSLAGIDGDRWMGFGFADQTLVWDGLVIEHRYRRLLEAQSSPVPLRVADQANPYN